VALAAALTLAACGSSGNGSPSASSSGNGGGGSSAKSGKTTTLRVSVLPIADLGPIFYGIDHGVFKKHGLKIDPVTATGGAAGISAMLSGSVQFVYTNTVSVFLAQQKHLPVTIVSGANDNVPHGSKDMAGMLVSKKISSPKDLEGKTIATNDLDNINQIYAQAWLKRKGVDTSKVKVVAIPFPQQVAALESGKIQGTLIPEPFLSSGMSDGLKNLGWPYRIGKNNDTPVGVYVAKKDWAKAHSGTVKAYVAAMTEATKAANDPSNKSALIDSIVKHTKLTKSVANKIQLSTYTTDVKTDLLKSEEKLLHNMGDLKANVKVKSMVFHG
jgi:NitT/TauT family transport system substrate-binding protein